MTKVEPSGDDTGNWLDTISQLGDLRRKDRATRIAEWASAAGLPHAKVLLGEEPYVEKVGFWRVPSGILRIRADAKGNFDPAERTEITTEEIDAIARASMHELDAQALTEIDPDLAAQ